MSGNIRIVYWVVQAGNIRIVYWVVQAGNIRIVYWVVQVINVCTLTDIVGLNTIDRNDNTSIV